MSNAHHIVGSGPRKVIVLHGWFGDRHSFAPVEPLLSRDITWVFMEYRGYGDMKETPGTFTMDEIAVDTLALADSLGFSDFSLVGHSMGGMAIQRVLAREPVRVRSLLAINPVPASGVPFDAQGLELFRGAADKRENRYAIIDYTTGGRRPQAFVDGLVDTSLRVASRDAFAAYFDAWSGTDFASEIEGLTQQVHVIVGENDRALGVDVVNATFMKWYPKATLEVLPDCGHYPMNEVPEALAASMNGFLGHFGSVPRKPQ